MISKGIWWLRSIIDPRWNADGNTSVGGFEMPDECAKALAEKEQTLGQRPADLEWGYMKD